MAEAIRRPTPRIFRPERRLLLGSLIGLANLVLLFYGVGGWCIASRLDDRALSAAARRESLVPNYGVDVMAVGEDTIELLDDGNDRLADDGTFGLAWDGGWGITGSVIGTQPDGSVLRQWEYRAGSRPAPGTAVDLNPRVFPGDPLVGRGIPFQNVAYQGELGEYPAWYVPGASGTWFIFVHGNSMTRLDGLRILPVAVEAGMPVLIPTVRGDEGAPEDPGGRLTYGKHEWRDLEAAVQYAIDGGAESIVLEGMSFGGAVVMAFLLESPLDSRVAGVILDSAVLDFERAVEYQAEEESLPLVGFALPGSLVEVAEWFAGVRFDVDWDYTHYVARAGELTAPMLLIHGTDDESIPIETSEELARRRPDLVVDFYTVAEARHAETWNADPVEYEHRVRLFLNEVEAIGD